MSVCKINISRSSIALLGVATSLGLASCKGGTGEPGGNVIDAGVLESDAETPDAGDVLPPPDGEGIDILFVIDDSGSMAEEQASLAANFNRFVTVLNQIEGGLPDIHIGVVSTNMGAGGFQISGCEGAGDNGVLHNAPQGACEAPTDRYIVDVSDGVGGRIVNYAGGDLAATFSCIAQLGIAGCGFEQPLEAMRKALDGSNGINAGFLRAEAFLAVVIITDEDDCSAADGGLYNTDPGLDAADSALGFLSSFRCFEFGVQCSPDSPRTPGAKSDCVPRADSQFMDDVTEYADFLKGLKDNPSNIIVAGIIGNPAPVSVFEDEGEPRLQASCSSGAGEAAPAVRLQAFLDQFPQRSTATTICDEDLSDALTVVADLLAEVVGS